MITEIQSKPLQDLYDYWKSKRVDQPVPLRAQIKPAEIVYCLPYVMILEGRQDPMRFFYRLVGTAIVSGFGTDFTGQFVDEMNIGEQAAKNAAMMRSVTETGNVSYYAGEFKKDDRRYMRQERIAMPLSSDGTTIDTILVGLNWMRIDEYHGV